MGGRKGEKLPLLAGDTPITTSVTTNQQQQQQTSPSSSKNIPATDSSTTTSARSLSTVNHSPNEEDDNNYDDDDEEEEGEDDTTHEEVIDMDQLRDIANRLDIPIEDLINRIRPQDSQPYNDGDNDGEDDEEGEEYDGDDEFYSDEEEVEEQQEESATPRGSTDVNNLSNIQTSPDSSTRPSYDQPNDINGMTTVAIPSSDSNQEDRRSRQQRHGASSSNSPPPTVREEDEACMADTDNNSCNHHPSSTVAPRRISTFSTSPQSNEEQHQPGGQSSGPFGKIPFFGNKNGKPSTNQYSQEAVPRKSALAKSSSFNTAPRPSRMRFWESSRGNFNQQQQESTSKRKFRGQSVVVSMSASPSSSAMGRHGSGDILSRSGSPQSSRMVSSLDPLASTSTQSPTTATPASKNVRFGPPDQLQEVKVFEVDNSLYISIEYARPVIGWVLLAVGLILRCVADCIKVYKIGKDFDSAYGFSTGGAIGDAIICLFFVLPLWYFFLRPSKHEKRFLLSWSGITLLGSIGIITGMTKVAPQSIADITNQWRATALFAIHPAVIVFYGKVFKNSVFIEELGGAILLLAGFCCAMLPIDILVDKWVFSEVLSFADSIYVASFLFLCVKARSSHVSVPVTIAAISVSSVILQLIVCAVAGVPFDNNTTESAFEFAMSGRSITIWVASSIGEVMSLSCFLVALRFIPPLTVSTTMVLETLITHFVSHLLFFNKVTAIWDLCEEDRTITSPPIPFFVSTLAPNPEDAYNGNLGKQIYCSQETAFSYTFTIGALLCVLAGGYLIYVSSIKRSKVELILKKLRKRKRPKNPYKARGGRRGGGGSNSSLVNNVVPSLPNPYENPDEARTSSSHHHSHNPVLMPIDDIPNIPLSSSTDSNSSDQDSSTTASSYEAPQLDNHQHPQGGGENVGSCDAPIKQRNMSSSSSSPPTRKEKKLKSDKHEKKAKSSSSSSSRSGNSKNQQNPSVSNFTPSSNSWAGGILGPKRRSALENEQETVYSVSPATSLNN